MKNYSEITPYITELAALSDKNNGIRPEMYTEHHVYRGLRDMSGNGVVTGLTEISRIKAKEMLPDGSETPCDGQLFYRGINVRDLVSGFMRERRFGFEETAYLLLFSELPDKNELDRFGNELGEYRSLPTSFVRDMILKAPGKDMMNILSRTVLALYAYDENPDDISVANVLRQCLQLIAVFPMLAVYGYQSYQHYHCGKSLFIHLPEKQLSTSENILRLLREDGKYSSLEATVLDLALVLHAEHGGGNNSTFATRVLTSSGTDTYAAIAAGMGSLKGPKHGGANIKAAEMIRFIQNGVSDPSDDGQIADYLAKIIRKEAGDGSGLIYGMGHAVYTLSDPRAVILKEEARKYAEKHGFTEKYKLIESIERLTPEVFLKEKGNKKPICANVDLYSGFIYEMLRIPEDLFTPLFTTARIAGWTAHRIEELATGGRIIRPAYKSVMAKREYVTIDKRIPKYAPDQGYVPYEERIIKGE